MAYDADNVPTARRTRRVNVFCAPALLRFTSHLLCRGFAELKGDSEWETVVCSTPTEFPQHAALATCADGGTTNASTSSAGELFILLQLHGAPHSIAADAAILALLEQRMFSCSTADRAVVKLLLLIHRPDEISMPQCSPLATRTHAVLCSHLPRCARLVFLGDRCANDEFYAEWVPAPRRHVVCHGFFEARLPRRHAQSRVVIGTHSAFGEMRAIEHVVRLLAAVFALTQPHQIMGVLGGVPASELTCEAISALLDRLELPPEQRAAIHIVDSAAVAEATVDRHCILVQPAGGFDTDVEPVFNTQLFHLHGRVRHGECAGAAHSRACIPVIFEMNGAECIERLHVVRVPYVTGASADDADFMAGAHNIAALIGAGAHQAMLRDNAARASELTPAFAAAQYAALFCLQSEAE